MFVKNMYFCARILSSQLNHSLSMGEIKRIMSVQDYVDVMGVEMQHPLIGVFDIQGLSKLLSTKRFYGINVLMLKKSTGSPFLYGDNVYHFQNGSIVAFSAGQLTGPPAVYPKDFRPDAKVLVWHDDMFHGLSMGQMMGDFPFMTYCSNCSLDLSDNERLIVDEKMKLIQERLKNEGENVNPIVLNRLLSQIMELCLKVFKRQISGYQREPKGFLSSFEYYLNQFIREKEGYKLGIPEVKYFAEKCNLTRNYFGENFQRQTGMRAKEYIQMRLVEVAKERLVSSSLSTRQVAQSLGFSHTNHFSFYFKAVVGETPNEYRINRFKALQRARLNCED